MYNLHPKKSACCCATGENPMLPSAHVEAVVSHVCMVHGSVGEYSKKFLQKLRRSNFVTPKNYLDFISTYISLLKDKDQYILGMWSPFFSDWDRLVECGPHIHMSHVLVFQPSADAWKGGWIS